MATSLVLLTNADDIGWMTDAACAGVPLEVFVPDHETPGGLEAARVYCNPCPARASCLAWAMLHRCEGYWGGTDTYQRRQALRVRTRAKCFLCASETLVYADPHEVCLACGMSWVRDVRLEPLAATPLPVSAA